MDEFESMYRQTMKGICNQLQISLQKMRDGTEKLPGMSAWLSQNRCSMCTATLCVCKGKKIVQNNSEGDITCTAQAQSGHGNARSATTSGQAQASTTAHNAAADGSKSSRSKCHNSPTRTTAQDT